MTRLGGWAVAAVLWMCAAGAAADVVMLKSGGKLEGVVVQQGDTVEVRTRTGVIKVRKDDIREIIAQKTPIDEYQTRRAALADTDLDGFLALADYCRSNSLLDEMGDVLKRAVELAPEHAVVQARWREYQKAYLRVPMTVQEERALAQSVGAGFRTVRTSHWVLVYDVDDTLARGRVNTLEKVYQTFYSYFEKEKFDLAIPQRPLEAVLFARPSDYAKVGPENSAGVFLHQPNRLFLYNAEDLEVQSRTRESQKIVAKNIKYLQQVIREATEPKIVDEARKALAEQRRLERKLLFQSRPYSDRGVFETMVHEAVHQLCFNSGLLPSADIPTWLCEGLAVYFEKYEQWSGPIGVPGQIQADKVNELRDAMEDRDLVALKELLAVGIAKGLLPYGDRAGVAYAQSWGLVHYLIHGKGTQFRRGFFGYLKKLGERHRDGKLERDLRGQFLTDMGIDLTTFEPAWIDYLKNLR